MSGKTAAPEKSMNPPSITLNNEMNVVRPSSDDCNQRSEAVAVAANSNADVSGGEANQRTADEKSSRPSTPPSKETEILKVDHAETETNTRCDSIGSAYPKLKSPPQPLTSFRNETSNDTNVKDTLHTPPAKKEQKHKEKMAENRANENAQLNNCVVPEKSHAVSNNNSSSEATNSNLTGITTAAESSDKPSKSQPESKKQQTGATTAATTQEQSNRDGGGSSKKTPSPSKKKKNKKKKKKRKASNPDNGAAQTKLADAPDQNQKASVGAVQEPIEDEKISIKPATSANNKKAANSSEIDADASISSPTNNRPNKSTKAATVAPNQSAHKEKINEKKDKASGNNAKVTTDKVHACSRIDVPSKTTATEAAKSDTLKEKVDEAKNLKSKEKSDSSSPLASSSSPSKKNTALSAENQTKVDDADDGAWETVEVKPRGRRGKGGNKKSSSGVQQNKSSTNSNNASNNGGRNHNNDHGGNNHDGGGGNSHHGGRRRGKRYRGEKRNSNNQQQQQHQQQQQQQNKMIKDVIFQILDVVDDEVTRRGGNGVKQGANGKLSDDKRNRSGNNEKRSGAKHHGQHHNNDHRRKQSSGVAANSGTTPPPSTVSNSSKSLRDVLVGSSTPAASRMNPAKGQGKTSNTSSGMNNASHYRAKGGAGNPDPSKGSSKIKPGMSYKSVIEPSKPPTPEPPEPETPKPKPNAWAKPPVSIKVKPKIDVEKKTNPEQQQPPPAEREPVDKPAAQNRNSLVPLVPLLATDNKTPSVSDANKPSTAIADDINAGEVACRTSASVTDNDTTEGAASPPLSTLLGPGNSCSASSSVASSLEAPHSSNRFRAHPSSSVAAEDDVGYHLLNVCGQLSEEINTFMSRRALALDVRRKERNAVLSALGDTLGKIWPGQCRVEMYGSCATQLDLPSSDLDLVICGLDDVVSHPQEDQQTMSAMHSNNTSNSFQEEEFLQEGLAAPIEEKGQEQPMSLDKGQSGNSLSGSLQEAIEPPTTPDQYKESAVESDPGMMLDESADDTLGIEHSAADGMENYSPGYHESSQQEGTTAATMENYSPGYSYHSNQHDVVTAENFSPGYQADEMGMEGYGHNYQTNGQEFYYSPYDYVSPLSLNAQRVLHLASELEKQPWAVQVKAIPTATVPVIKMLADPSRLPGLAGTGDSWMIQQHVPPPPISPEQASVQNQGAVSSMPHFFSPHPMAQWRGTDIKNGLQPVDITFEGPEHGGIGSTTYSTRVVEDACNETGLPPESTPVVQVASVLKELLAQRRLNEPFSGGLSSYGLLVLLLAILKDRKIIQEDMKEVEKQRQKVSGHDPKPRDNISSSRKNNPPFSAAQVVAGQLASPGVESSDKSSAAPSVTSKPTVSSSWASIAKKSNGSTARTESLSTITKSTSDSATTPTAKTGVNYSQVVQKESKDLSKFAGQIKDQTFLRKDGSGPTNGGPNTQQPSEIERHSAEEKQILPQSSNVALDGPAVLSQVTPSSADDSKIGSSSVPQGSNDVFEVLCSGELTSGKLMMHFLLFYGQHFDSQATLIDVNGTHHPGYGKIDFNRLSPFVARPPGGTIDPITGMFSVDPIVVYDPLEGAIDHNVSKRCFCWNNVRWVFAQCYMTVSSVVETSGTCTKSSLQSKNKQDPKNESIKSSGVGKSGNMEMMDKARSGPNVVTPILELLLSF